MRWALVQRSSRVSSIVLAVDGVVARCRGRGNTIKVIVTQPVGAQLTVTIAAEGISSALVTNRAIYRRGSVPAIETAAARRSPPSLSWAAV